MAVPKKKTSKSKRNMRRSHHAISKINVIVDKETGEYRLPHQMNPMDGLYNGRKILILKQDLEEDDLED
ncbi:MAG: 50S ribosomal protein L32 [Alphaproteobacteria bacterium]|nr:50S ribosomal protein L32 [Alphaproteobacteria bacterium]